MPVLAPPAAPRPHGGDDNDPRKKSQYIKNIDYASQHGNLAYGRKASPNKNKKQAKSDGKKKNFANRPSERNKEYVTTQDGRRVRNMAFRAPRSLSGLMKDPTINTVLPKIVNKKNNNNNDNKSDNTGNREE